MKLHLLIIITVFSFTSCQGNKGKGEEAVSYNWASDEVATTEASAGYESKQAAPNGTYRVAVADNSTTPTQNNHIVVAKVPAKIIKNASVEFQVDDIEKSHQRIKDILGKHSAYFGSDNTGTSSYRKDNNMTIRVPSKSFDALMAEVMKESIYTNYKNISAEDVTDQFVDAEARLKTKKEVEQRYLALLKDAKKVQDILDIEDKLRVIREEIEATEGRLKLLNDQVDYSTINLNIYQTLDYVAQPEAGFISSLKEAFVNGWRSLVDFFVGIVRLWPFLLIIAVAVALVVRRIRRKRAQ